MTKAELIKMLEGVLDTAEVVMSKDSEGNGYSPCAGYMWPAKYVPDSKYSGDIYNPEDRDETQYWNHNEETKDAVVLWPTN